MGWPAGASGIATGLSVLALAVGGCSSGTPAGTSTAHGTTPAPGRTASTTGLPGAQRGAPGNGARLDVPAFRQAMARPGTVVLDVRTAQEYAEGHLPGAVLADVNAPDFGTKLAALDRSRPYAVYCRSGNRSQAAVEVMREAGFIQVVDLTGGILAWTEAGGEITK